MEMIMKKSLRILIREQLSKIVESLDGGVLDDAMSNIETQMSDNIKNLDVIKKATELDVDNKMADIKAKKQLKSQLDTKSADRQGLERFIPTREKEINVQNKQIADIEKAKVDFEKAQKELEKQKLKIAQDSKMKDKPSPVLNSLQSPI